MVGRHAVSELFHSRANDLFDSYPCWEMLQLSPFLVHGGSLFRTCHRFRDLKMFVFQIVLSHRCMTSTRNVSMMCSLPAPMVLLSPKATMCDLPFHSVHHFLHCSALILHLLRHSLCIISAALLFSASDPDNCFASFNSIGLHPADFVRSCTRFVGILSLS